MLFPLWNYEWYSKYTQTCFVPTIVAYAEIKVGYSLRDSKQILQFYYCNARFGLKTHHSWGDKFIPLPVEVVVSQRVIGFQRISRPVGVKLCVCHWVSFIFSAEIEDDSSGFFFIHLNHCLHLAVRRELCVCALKSCYVWFYSMISVIMKAWSCSLFLKLKFNTIREHVKSRLPKILANLHTAYFEVHGGGGNRPKKNKKRKEKERKRAEKENTSHARRGQNSRFFVGENLAFATYF